MKERGIIIPIDKLTVRPEISHTGSGVIFMAEGSGGKLDSAPIHREKPTAQHAKPEGASLQRRGLSAEQAAKTPFTISPDMFPNKLDGSSFERLNDRMHEKPLVEWDEDELVSAYVNWDSDFVKKSVGSLDSTTEQLYSHVREPLYQALLAKGISPEKIYEMIEQQKGESVRSSWEKALGRKQVAKEEAEQGIREGRLFAPEIKGGALPGSIDDVISEGSSEPADVQEVLNDTKELIDREPRSRDELSKIYAAALSKLEMRAGSGGLQSTVYLRGLLDGIRAEEEREALAARDDREIVFRREQSARSAQEQKDARVREYWNGREEFEYSGQEVIERSIMRILGEEDPDRNIEAATTPEEVRDHYRKLLKYMKILHDQASDADRHLRLSDHDAKVSELRQQMDDYDVNERQTVEDLQEKALRLREFVQVDKYFAGVQERRDPRAYLPESIEELMDAIMAQDQGNTVDDYQVGRGERYQLIDDYGEVRVENFLEWMRARSRRIHKDNPQDQVTPLSAITVKMGISQMTFYEIIYTPRYYRTKLIRIQGNEEVPETAPEHRPIHSMIGGETPHKDFKTAHENILVEAWLFGLSHSASAAIHDARGRADEWIKVMTSLFRHNDFTNSNRIIQLFKMSATDRDELKNYIRGHQGEVGRAFQRMVVAHNYLVEVANDPTKVEYRDELGRTLTGAAADNANAFYKVFGGKTSGGAKAFHRSLAAQALDRDASSDPDNLRDINTSQGKYIAFVDSLLDELKSDDLDYAEYQAIPDLDARIQAMKNQLGQVTQLERKYYTVRFDTVSALVDLRIELEEALRGGRAITRAKRLKIMDQVKNRIWGPSRAGLGPRIKEEFVDNLTWAVDGTSAGDLFDDTEKFGFGLLKKIMNIDRGGENGLNINFDIRMPQSNVGIVSKAITAGAAHGLRLEDNEIEHAQIWARTMQNWTGIDAKNETNAIGYDTWSKLINFGKYFHRRLSRGGVGNKLLDGHFKHIGYTFFEGIRLRLPGKDKFNTTLIDFLEKNLKDNPEASGEFTTEAMSQFADLHLQSGLSLLNVVSDEGDEMKFDQLVTETPQGNLDINTQAFNKLMSGPWQNVRYTFDQLYKWNDSSVKIRDWVEEGEGDDRITVFQTRSMRDHAFSEDIINMRMNERYGEAPGNEEEMARNVFAFLISQEILAHTMPNRTKKLWTIPVIEQIEALFANFEDKRGDPFLNPKEFDRILEVALTSYWKIYGREAFIALLAALLGSTIAAGGESVKQVAKAA